MCWRRPLWTAPKPIWTSKCGLSVNLDGSENHEVNIEKFHNYVYTPNEYEYEEYKIDSDSDADNSGNDYDVVENDYDVLTMTMK